jgi:hypothetical protein
MAGGPGAAEEASPRARALAEELRAAVTELIAVVERIEPDRWSYVRKPDEWSPGKDAEHVADAAALHLWHVRRSLGLRQAGGRPAIERARLTALRSQGEIVALLGSFAECAASLIEGLTDAQLELFARPPRTPPRTVADIVARPLIGHVETHRRAIEAKLRAAPSLQ